MATLRHAEPEKAHLYIFACLLAVADASKCVLSCLLAGWLAGCLDCLIACKLFDDSPAFPLDLTRFHAAQLFLVELGRNFRTGSAGKNKRPH